MKAMPGIEATDTNAGEAGDAAFVVFPLLDPTLVSASICINRAAIHSSMHRSGPGSAMKSSRYHRSRTLSLIVAI
jgi:hypothetical protein